MGDRLLLFRVGDVAVVVDVAAVGIDEAFVGAVEALPVGALPHVEED